MNDEPEIDDTPVEPSTLSELAGLDDDQLEAWWLANAPVDDQPRKAERDPGRRLRWVRMFTIAVAVSVLLAVAAGLWAGSNTSKSSELDQLRDWVAAANGDVSVDAPSETMFASTVDDSGRTVRVVTVGNECWAAVETPGFVTGPAVVDMSVCASAD